MICCMAEPELVPIDGGQRYLIRGVARPGSRDAEAAALAVNKMLIELIQRCPEDCFIKYIKAECDGLRDGVPRGTRLSVSVVFQPYPKEFLQKRGER